MRGRRAAGLGAALVLLALSGGLVPMAPARAQAPEATAVAATCTRQEVVTGTRWLYFVDDQALSNGGRRLVYSVHHDPTDYPYPVVDTAHAVFLFDAATGQRRRIRSHLFTTATSPAISADGNWVVLSATPRLDQEFVIYPTGYEGYLYEVATRRSWALTPLRDGLDGDVWAISEDGGRMLVSAENPYAPWTRRTWVYDRLSGTKLRIPKGAVDLSPDGSTVLVSSWQDFTGQNPDRGPELFAFDIATFVFTQLTDRPDGDKRSFDRAEFTDGGQSVLFATASGTALVDLGSGETLPIGEPLAAAAWARAGGHAFYSATDDPFGANGDGSYEFFVQDLAVDTTQQLTDEPVHPGYTPTETIAPDGGAAAYSTEVYRHGPNSVVLLRTCGPAPAPDSQIGPAGGASVGDGLRWATARPDQQASSTVAPQTSTSFTVRVQNDRSRTDSFTVSLAEGGAPGYVVAVRRDGVDVTAAVRAGTYRIGPVAAGASVDLELRVTAATAPPGSSHTVDVTARSVANPISRDTVRALSTTSRS